MQALWNGQVVAESDRTVRVEGNHYFPPASVRADYLTESRQTSRCLWKGKAHYYDLDVEGAVNPGAAWYYPKPTILARRIRGHVAFWHGVEVRRVDAAPR